MTPCPSCGHIPTMQTSFCPQCGATMPDEGDTAMPERQPAVDPQGPTVAWRADAPDGDAEPAQPTTSPPTSGAAAAPAAPYAGATAGETAGSGGVLETDEEPPNAIIPLILSFVCFMCCWPAAIGAMLTAIFAMTNAQSGNVATARTLTRVSYAISISAMVLFVIAMCGYFGLGVFSAIAGAGGY